MIHKKLLFEAARRSVFWFRNGPLKLQVGDLNAGSQQPRAELAAAAATLGVENSILYSGINFGSRGPGTYLGRALRGCRLLTAAFLPPFATYRVKNYQRGVGGAKVSYGPVLSNIYVNTLPECHSHTTTTRDVNGILRKFSQYLGHLFVESPLLSLLHSRIY